MLSLLLDLDHVKLDRNQLRLISCVGVHTNSGIGIDTDIGGIYSGRGDSPQRVARWSFDEAKHVMSGLNLLPNCVSDILPRILRERCCIDGESDRARPCRFEHKLSVCEF